MLITSVIIKPLITEKSTAIQASKNAYAFNVHQQADKINIKKAVEALYNVKVASVRTMTRKGKPRRTRSGTENKSSWKRAIVTLQPDNRIELF